MTRFSFFITRLESTWLPFNKEKVSADDITHFSGIKGVAWIPCDMVETAEAIITTNKERGILYNPNRQADELTFILGHELGHIILGHHYNHRNHHLEHEADIIGSLCWIPNPDLQKIYYMEPDLTPDRLLWHINPEMTEEFAYHVAQKRLQAYSDYLSLACSY